MKRFSSRHAHGPEEEDHKLGYAPLENTSVIKELHDRLKKDDSGDDAEQEQVHGGRGQESHTVTRKL
jgi:hypothetical protein